MVMRDLDANRINYLYAAIKSGGISKNWHQVPELSAKIKSLIIIEFCGWKKEGKKKEGKLRRSREFGVIPCPMSDDFEAERLKDTICEILTEAQLTFWPGFGRARNHCAWLLMPLSRKNQNLLETFDGNSLSNRTGLFGKFCEVF